ncbi:hypothetical protein NGA_0724400, partial [Nannochloropsis gaditana CCMP526]
MAHHSHSRIALRWVHWIKQLRWVVLGLWCVVIVLGATFGLKFLDITVSDFPAPAGSPSHASGQALLEYFPEQEGVLLETLLLQASADVTQPPLSTSLVAFYHAYAQSLTSHYGAYLKGPILSYYLLNAFTPELATPLLASDN